MKTKKELIESSSNQKGSNFLFKEVYTTVLKKVNNFYIGYIKELSGVNTQGKTLDEVRSNLKEAVSLILKSNKELARRKS